MTSTKDPSGIRRRTHPKATGEVTADDYDFTDDVPTSKKTRQCRRRTRIHDSDDDDDELDNNKNDILPKWKMALVIGAICVCFALIFPTVFAPLINGFWGRSTADNNGNNPGNARRPPMGGRSPPPSRGGPPLHPQMHTPLQHGAGDTTGSRGRGGMFTWMMPFYTIGIVAFLGYNLYKRMFKSDKRKKSRRYEESDDSDSEAGTGELGSRKLRMVQQRLRKTEAAMREILEQLEVIANASGDAINGTTNAANNAEENKENADKDGVRLSDEQVHEVERGLRELRELSDLYKKQQQEIGDYDEDDDDEDHSEGYFPSDIDENQNATPSTKTAQNDSAIGQSSLSSGDCGENSDANILPNESPEEAISSFNEPEPTQKVVANGYNRAAMKQETTRSTRPSAKCDNDNKKESHEKNGQPEERKNKKPRYRGGRRRVRKE